MDYRDRRGKFKLPYYFLNDTDWGKIVSLMKDMIVFHTESNFATSEVTYWACHPSFDEAPAYAECPEYEISTSHSWKQK